MPDPWPVREAPQPLRYWLLRTGRMSEYAAFLDLPRVRQVHGEITLPGSKSISNRILLLAALARGTTWVGDLLASDDTDIMLQALRTLGVAWHQLDDSRNYSVTGCAGAFSQRHADLFMGNAGTAIRPLTATLAVLGGDYTLHGVARMHQRPIGDLVDALNAVGMRISYGAHAGYPPLHIESGVYNRQPLRVRGNVSSQFLTALLMAAPLLASTQPVTIDVIGELISKPYVDITLNLMQRFGVAVERCDWQRFTLGAGQQYQSPGRIHVEGDASSASYFLAAGAIAGGPVRVHGIGRDSIQGDLRFIETLQQMGVTVRSGENWLEAEASGALQPIDADFNHIPDAAMTVALLALHADGTSVLRNIGSWRVKETDRISAMATELRKLGALVEEGSDFLRITPPAALRSASIDTYDDHRIAMCFSLASLDGAVRAGVPLRILDPGCVAKTFPQYFDAFARISHC